MTTAHLTEQDSGPSSGRLSRISMNSAGGIPEPLSSRTWDSFEQIRAGTSIQAEVSMLRRIWISLGQYCRAEAPVLEVGDRKDDPEVQFLR
jgi:hypothetical protein